MIVRIVKMVFQPGQVSEFLEVFNERKEKIRNAPGCIHLELWRDAKCDYVFFTYSKWESEEYLDKYRFSPLFKDIWTKVKPMFLEKAHAWSVEQEHVLS